MLTHHDITLADLEHQFGTPEGKVRFPRFCNAAIVSEAKGPLSTLPRFDDSPGQDGGFDGSWTVPDNALAVYARPFALPGWNALQYKSLGSNSAAADAFQRLKQSVRGAAQKLISRANRPDELRQYTLFTNLNLGRVEASSTARRAKLRSFREELIAAIREDLPSTEIVQIVIVSAAELQAIVNQRPALRETFFGDTLFDTWDRAWSTMALQPNTQPDIPLVGRAPQLEQLKAKLADPAVRFIGLSGASGMGKTRLGLEATRDLAPQAYFVRLGSKANFLAKDLVAYAGSSRILFVIEDLRQDEAKNLAQQAALHPGICILASIPTEEHLPRFGLVESPAIRSLRLPPLNSNEARELMKAVQAKLDSDAFDWVLQEAGGNPQILLVAAALGPDIRRQAGQLRRSVAESFLRKAKDVFGEDVEPVLELLSVLSPFDTKGDTQIDAVRSVFGLSVNASTIRHYKDRLVDAAFVEGSGKKGRHLNVSPPLLAAYLVERALDGHADRLLRLYQLLDDDGRERLFDRLVSIDGSAGQGLWAHVFGASGPFVDQKGLEDNQSSLRILSRAAPRQTADFLRSRISDVIVLLRRNKKRTSDSLTSILADDEGYHEYNRRLDDFRSGIYSVLYELTEHPDSGRVALSLVEQLATLEPELDGNFSKLFTDCFILWMYDFPVPPKERWSIIDRLMQSSTPSARKLGYEALFIITDPPNSKGGQAVHRRRLGEQLVHLTWNEVWDHHVIAFQRHLATAIEPGSFWAQANERLPGAFGDLQRLPPVRIMPLLRSVERAFWKKKLDLAPAKFLGLLISTRERFDEIWELHSAAEWAAHVPEFNRELDGMMVRIERAPLAVRLAIWLDREPGFGWEQIDGTRRHRYEIELEKIAREATSHPRKLTAKLIAQLTGDGSFHGAEFARDIGRADRNKQFWSRFAALQAQSTGAWVFGSYCEGVSEHDASYVDCALEKAMPKAGANMLLVLKKLGPTPTNRRRLEDLIKRKKVTSSELARMFMTGRWLDQVPTSEVKVLLTYIAKDTSPEVTYELLQVFNLYLHPNKKIPLSVLPIAEAALLRPAAQHQDTGYDADNLAESIMNSSVAKSLRLFQSLLKKAASSEWKKRGWNPVSGLGGSMDFFHRIRAAKPAAVYKLLFEYLTSRHRIDVLDHDATPFDLANHAAVLLNLTMDDAEYALTAARYLRVEQSGFWQFVFALLEQHPSDEKIRNALAGIFLNEWRWGYINVDSPPPGQQIIERELAQSALPVHGRIFLEQVRAELSKRFGGENDDSTD
jgi:hypothetical protein